ncbi:MAG: phosphopantothenate/pantothenate synthetase family protein, partial [Candidatus Hadarchaeales archaeon]
VVLVPLEDGDRTQALKRLGKKVIAIDLNPMSRTAQAADITIVDNIVRAMPLMVEEAAKLRKLSKEALEKIVKNFSNKENLRASFALMAKGLGRLARK